MIRSLTYSHEIAPGIIVTVKATETGTLVMGTRDEPGGWDAGEFTVDEATISVFGEVTEISDGDADQEYAIDQAIKTTPIRDVIDEVETEYEDAA